VNEQYTPIGYSIPPEIEVVSPLNQTYTKSSAFLVFTVDKVINWTGYSVDGKDNVTFTGNITLTGLSNGLHNITVYAKDTFGNTGASEAVAFTLDYEPFPTVPVAAVSGVAVAVVVVGLIFYYRKRNH
jgi:hypothetical protein